MQTAVRVLLTVVVVTSACLLGFDMAQYYLFSPWTRDARVRADVSIVAPDVSGFVTDVRVHNDQFVKKGDVLIVLDQERYRNALADAEAIVAARFAQYQMLLDQFKRRSKLTLNLSITPEDLDNAHQQANQAAAAHQQAIVARDLAALNLKRTEVRALVNGFVTNLNLAPGTYATPAKPVLAVIDSDSYRVEAYFEETKIPQIKVGEMVDIQPMDGTAALQGKVEGIARGITDYDNHEGPQLLANVNPTFTWVRLAQRIPVYIHLTDVPAGVQITSGMTCTVVLKEGAEPHIGATARRLVSELFASFRRLAT